MSIWTHVVGAIRVDGLPGMSKIEDIERILGKVITFQDLIKDDEEDETTTLPMGSEGSLQYKIIEYSTGLPWVVIPIWGDLRDYSNVGEIEAWWNKALEELQFVRDASLRIQVEGQKPVVLWTKE